MTHVAHGAEYLTPNGHKDMDLDPGELLTVKVLGGEASGEVLNTQLDFLYRLHASVYTQFIPLHL